MLINTDKQNFKGLSPLAAPLNIFYDSNAALPTLFIETGVTLGRSYEANKRGGKKEAAERFIEQGTSAVIWLWGVQALKKAGELFGKKILKIENLNFDIGFDEVRNPVKNNKISSRQLCYKTTNVLAATAIATYFIGFILPKINHKISSKIEQKEKEKSKTTFSYPAFDEFRENCAKHKNNAIPFTSVFSEGAYNLAHVLENNSTARLLITDSGVIAGRSYNARNKYDRIENLFRDISSIYFYLFSSSHIKKFLNKMKSNTDINPKLLESTIELLNENSSKLNKDNFKKTLLGEITPQNQKKLDSLFKDKTTVSVEEFCNEFKGYENKAQEMAKLQPIFEGKGVLLKSQAKDVLSQGLITDPDFLSCALNRASGGKALDKNKFISYKTLDKMRLSIDDFIGQIDSYLKKNSLSPDKKTFQKIANKNIFFNFLFSVIGTVASTFVLAIIIPKIQYWITEKLSGENKFPGSSDFKK